MLQAAFTFLSQNLSKAGCLAFCIAGLFAVISSAHAVSYSGYSGGGSNYASYRGGSYSTPSYSYSGYSGGGSNYGSYGGPSYVGGGSNYSSYKPIYVGGSSYSYRSPIYTGGSNAYHPSPVYVGSSQSYYRSPIYTGGSAPVRNTPVYVGGSTSTNNPPIYVGGGGSERGGYAAYYSHGTSGFSWLQYSGGKNNYSGYNGTNTYVQHPHRDDWYSKLAAQRRWDNMQYRNYMRAQASNSGAKCGFTTSPAYCYRLEGPYPSEMRLTRY